MCERGKCPCCPGRDTISVYYGDRLFIKRATKFVPPIGREGRMTCPPFADGVYYGDRLFITDLTEFFPPFGRGKNDLPPFC